MNRNPKKLKIKKMTQFHQISEKRDFQIAIFLKMGCRR